MDKDKSNLVTKTGGAYIPPAKLRMMQKDIEDKNSMAYQRLSWEALKKSINGLINKINISNISVSNYAVVIVNVTETPVCLFYGNHYY